MQRFRQPAKTAPAAGTEVMILRLWLDTGCIVNSDIQPQVRAAGMQKSRKINACLQPIHKADTMHATVYLEDDEYIALCDLLKLAGLAESGGRAKAAVAAGLVLRNGGVETRKTAKIRGGEVIEYNGAVLEIENGHDPEA